MCVCVCDCLSADSEGGRPGLREGKGPGIGGWLGLEKIPGRGWARWLPGAFLVGELQLRTGQVLGPILVCVSPSGFFIVCTAGFPTIPQYWHRHGRRRAIASERSEAWLGG